ncbi:MAG: hypothetical protein ABF242_11125 [Flavobacteriales bacterium]
MKKLLLILLIGIYSSAISQSEEVVKVQYNELKINIGMFVLGTPDITYERIFTDEYSAGISLAIGLLGDDNFGINYAITPHFRLFFGKKRARGFFMEANASVFEERTQNYDYWIRDYGTTNYTNIGLGLAAGYKVISESNWVGEIYLGGGRNLMHNTNKATMEYYPRLGFVVGRRF